MFLNTIHPSRGNNRGLTVAELLVVGGIILFIGTLIIVWVTLRVQSFQGENRDSEREIHMRQFIQALTFYQSNNGNYPYPAEGVVLNGVDDVLSKALRESQLLSKIPLDPLNKGDYRYTYTSGNGTTFMIEYYLETDAISGKKKGLNRVFP